MRDFAGRDSSTPFAESASIGERLSRLPQAGAGDGDAADLVGILAGDGAVEVVERAIVVDDRGLVGEGLVDACRARRCR